MQDIDFLPAQYRKRQALRQRRPWRAIILASVGALVALMSAAQYYRFTSIHSELEAIRPQYELITQQNEQLAGLQSRLSTARATAELLTYLRHPWPRTQILNELLAPLPDHVTFTRVDITRRAAVGPTQRRRSRGERKAEEAKRASLPPASRDLEQFREETDRAPTVVTISGTTSHSAALHHYLGTLEESELFTNVELSAMESSEVDPGGSLRFSAELTVRPGYGQPGGMTGSHKSPTKDVRNSHENSD